MKTKIKIAFPEYDLLSVETKVVTNIQTEDATKNHVWVTARGLDIPVKEMSTNHIKNTINCWNGDGNMRIPKDYLGGKDKWLKIFSNELASRN